MKPPTDYPTITLEGRTYVMLPVEDFTKLQGKAPWIPEGDATPLEVVRRHIEDNVSKARAWREYLGLTQAEVAARMGISQAALSQLENQKRPRRASLEKLAKALGLNVEQLR
jgi:DNA-binding XRE family transcriptional regulator